MTVPDIRATLRLPWAAEDPYSYYQERRVEGELFWDNTIEAWMVLGYRPARQILAEPGWTSSPLANANPPGSIALSDPGFLRRNILFTDGDDHRRLRDAVRNVFTPAFIAGLRDGVEALAVETINSIPAGAEFDFMTKIGLPLPISVAAAWLDLDLEAARLLADESPAISRMLSDPNDLAAAENGAAAFATLLTEFLPLAADRRRHPGDDLLSYIATASDLDLDDVVTTAIIIAIAGHDTTANLLGASMLRLLAPPRESARAVNKHPIVDDQLITELLRLDGPVQAVVRTATTTHIYGDATIHPGEAALVVVAAANRDPATFADPDELRTDRVGPPPLAFGHGAHFCLGAALARVETGVALNHLLPRQPALRGNPTWRNTPAIRGPQTLPCVFAQAAPTIRAGACH